LRKSGDCHDPSQRDPRDPASPRQTPDMTKSVRKLQAEIDRALKQVDEVSPPPNSALCAQGICSLDQLEVRLENANSLQMKEKIETEIKKEIKKLQRHRDVFKQLMKDSEVKDKTKVVEARHRIEEQMEKFRELEKEYK
jgi:CCR4-NOT transcription complex subunit 3